ncbi:hypothetical protein C8Q74DRAFT_1215963 [Fomes fomentarius]|nr:hypothetical protein C8Q74DRAFT_1215963 [Fomes fomentarius]
MASLQPTAKANMSYPTIRCYSSHGSNTSYLLPLRESPTTTSAPTLPHGNSPSNARSLVPGYRSSEYRRGSDTATAEFIGPGEGSGYALYCHRICSVKVSTTSQMVSYHAARVGTRSAVGTMHARVAAQFIHARCTPTPTASLEAIQINARKHFYSQGDLDESQRRSIPPPPPRLAQAHYDTSTTGRKLSSDGSPNTATPLVRIVPEVEYTPDVPGTGCRIDTPHMRRLRQAILRAESALSPSWDTTSDDEMVEELVEESLSIPPPTMHSEKS